MASVKLALYSRVALVLHGIALLMLFMYFGRTIFIPLFFSFLVAILLYPFVKRLERLHFPRVLASITAIIIFILVIGGLVYFF